MNAHPFGEPQKNAPRETDLRSLEISDMVSSISNVLFLPQGKKIIDEKCSSTPGKTTNVLSSL